MRSTIDEFLEPWLGPEADDLLHSLVHSARPSSNDSRYQDLGQTRRWHAFDFSNSFPSPKLRAILDLQLTPDWRPWVPSAALIVHNERQLESLFYSTLITRVNIALEHAFPVNKQRMTVVVCPVSFDSHYSRDGEEVRDSYWIGSS